MSTLCWTYELIKHLESVGCWELLAQDIYMLLIMYVCTHICKADVEYLPLFPLSISETGSFTESRVHEFRKTS